ncbi:hypothetical protein POTOM_006422 [Populus tomentosa]|uniref:Pentatricopeptide repeat-containing protein n=1 Tax=Populus tomentosa TaxID=118781 RepID=A0A8X8AKZ1_POPTO|nr:hypothetical protein POTOM_006422 [Populus tomentosa]
MLVKRGDIDGVYGYFLWMRDKNVMSRTLMISGFVQCSKTKKAIDLFMKMKVEVVRSNELIVVSVFAAYADLGELDLGRSVHEYSRKQWV